MTKKTVITALCLLIVLAVLIVGYKLLKQKNEADEAASAEEAEEQVIRVNTYDSADMTSLSYAGVEDALSFGRDANGAWFLEDDPNFPITYSYVDNMANAVSGLAVSREIETEDDGSFGFDAPRLIIRGEYSDGETLRLIVGATNDFNGQVYLKDEVNGKIYLVESSFPDVFDKTRNDLMETDEYPDIDTDKLVSITVRNAAGDENTITEETSLADAASIFQRMTFSSDGAFYADDAKREECGISATDGAFAELAYKSDVSVTNDDGSMSTVQVDDSLKLVFGKSHVETETDDEGNVTESTYYYYTTPSSFIVYSTTEAVYEELMRYATYTPPAETE